MKKRYRLTVTLIEDAHFGSGTGAGNTDAYIDRDAQGYPVIRASHLKGVLRETAELYCELKGCDNEQINALFGVSGSERGSMTLTSLYAKDTQQIADCPIWTSTARQPGSRLPQEDTLRVIEHCPAGLIFVGEIELADVIYDALLKRLIQRTDRFGGHRNRGNGLVQCALEPFENTSRRLQGQPSQTQPRLRLVLAAIEPLLLPNSGHPGNLLATEGFIRGQILKGALVQYALQCNQMQIANQWLSGAISVGDALPLPMSANNNLKTAEVIPIPLSMETPKPGEQKTQRPWWAKTEHTVDFVISNNDKTYDGLNKSQDAPKLKRPGARQFLYRPDAKTSWQRYTPSIEVRMRVNLENLKMRDSDSKPGLFSHEEIAEKTRFISVLQFNDVASAQAFAEVCDGLLCQDAWLRIGREGRPVRVMQALWLDPDQQAITTDHWRLTLMSDTILRDEMLAFVVHPDITTLITAAGKNPSDYPGCDQWTLNAKYCESTQVHGFNALTGLRRVPAIALRRGSDFKIDGTGSARLAADLTAKQALGERTAEGYGRFMINFEPFAGTLPPPDEAPPAIITNDEEILLSLSRELANNLNVNNRPSHSQLGWLRGMAEGGKAPLEILESIKTATSKQGGKAWKNFPIKEIEEAFNQGFLKDNKDRQLQCLIALVRWLKPRTKESTEQEPTI
ncbi:RAMP superfamily CRISPR-associated protein [Methylobacter psychrophilus]|uniref:RAMP superfamily CRISPR-associated protein n=1 Tax=Methylobacter psychrophilus TaxID=96941 RepID=UPI0021D48EF3|nr:RAMP superfamily CRISPR-associated protein [Methylobacter psychrophilus]